MALDAKQIIDKLLKLKPAQKVLLLLSINAAIGALIYFMLIAGTMEEISVKKEKRSVVEAALKEKRIIAANIPKFKREKALLEKKLELALTKLPVGKDVPGLYSSIRSAADSVNLNILSLTVKRDKKKGFYAEVPIAVKVKGNYQSFLDFCDKVSRLERIVNIHSISVTAGKLSNNPDLSINFTLTAFRFLEQGK